MQNPVQPNADGPDQRSWRERWWTSRAPVLVAFLSLLVTAAGVVISLHPWSNGKDVGTGDIKVERGSYVSNPPPKYAANGATTLATTPTLHVLLFNSGRATSLVTHVQLHVDAYTYLDLCLPPQGDVPDSSPYTTMLPVFPTRTDSTIDIEHRPQELTSGRPESLKIPLTVPGYASEDTQLYVVHVTLQLANPDGIVDGGRYLVVEPSPPWDNENAWSYFLPQETGYIHESANGLLPATWCYARNLAEWLRFRTAAGSAISDPNALPKAPFVGSGFAAARGRVSPRVAARMLLHDYPLEAIFAAQTAGGAPLVKSISGQAGQELLREANQFAKSAASSERDRAPLLRLMAQSVGNTSAAVQ